MRLITAILFIDIGNCFRLSDQSFKKLDGENANEIIRIASEGNHKPTILDQFYDYLEKVKQAKVIEKEMELLRENVLKLSKNSPWHGLATASVEEGKSNSNNYIRQRGNVLGTDKSYGRENLKQKNVHGFSMNEDRSNSERVRRQSDQNRIITPSNSDLKFKRNKRDATNDGSDDLKTTNKDVEESTPEEVYVGEPSRIHISEIKEELNKLQDLVEILRDQQYILSLLNNIDNRDDRLAKNSTRVSKLNNMFQNVKSNLKNDRQNGEDFQNQEDGRNKIDIREKSISQPGKETATNSNRNLTSDVSNMKQEIDQLRAMILNVLRKRKQSDTTEKEKKITEELEEQRKEINLLKEMVKKLSGSAPNNDNDVGMDSNNEISSPPQTEESDENNSLHQMLEKLYRAEEKLNSTINKPVEENTSPDEIVASTATTKFKHQNLFPKHNEHQQATFHKNNYFLTDFFNKTARTDINSHKLRTSDPNSELRSIISALNGNKQKTDRRKELIRIQKELASLKKLTQNDDSDDSDDLDSLLNDLDMQRDDSFELNSDSDIADKLLDLEERIKASKKTDVHKTLRELERQIKTLNAKEDKKTHLMKLLKKVKDIPQSKSLDISDDNEDIPEELKVLKEAIDSLQPKEDDAGIEEEGKENDNFGLMLQKLISGRKPKPSVAKPTSNKMQALANQLATMLKKHPPSIEANIPDEEGTHYCKYGGFNSAYDQDQNSGNFFADSNYDNYRPNIGNYNLEIKPAPSNFYDNGNYGKPNFGHNLKNLLTYGQDYTTTGYGPNIRPINFPQAIKPYSNRNLQNKINLFNQFPSTYHPDVYYENDASSTPYYPRPQSMMNFYSKIYPPPQRQYQQQNLNYKTGILNSFQNNLFHGPKTNSQKPGYLKTYSEAEKIEPHPYATSAPKYPFNQQQYHQVEDTFTQNRINDLKKQIYNLQSIINTLNRPEYIQRPEDKITAYNLDKQITELKNIVNYLSQNSPEYQRPIDSSKSTPNHPNKYLPSGNYQNVNPGFKTQASSSNVYNSQAASENSGENFQEQNRGYSSDVNQYQTYSNAPDTSSNVHVKVNIPDLPTYEGASLHIRPNFDSADRSANQNLNTQTMPNEIHPSDEDNTRYKRSAINDLNTKKHSTESITEDKGPDALFNMDKLGNELNELIDDITSKIEEQTSTGAEIPEGFTSEMENYLLDGLEKISNSNGRLSSLISHLLTHTLNDENSNDEIDKFVRRKRSETEDEYYSSELLPLLLNGNTITKELAEENESDDAEQNPEQTQNLSDLNAVLDQLKTQLDAVPQNSIARVSGTARQPYQKPNNYYYPTISKNMPMQSLFSFSNSNKKKSKKLDIFGKIVDKILDKLIDKAPIVIFKLLHRFFGLGSLDLTTTQEGNYYGGGLQSFQNFGLSGLIPMVILRMFSNLSYFISQLQRSRFMRNFLVPGLILLGVSGMIVFLIWWLQTDNNYATQHYTYDQNSDYSTGNYYGNEMSHYGNEYNNNNQYQNPYNDYTNDYRTNSLHNSKSYRYSVTPYENKKNYKSHNNHYTNYNPYLRYSTKNLNRNHYNENDNLYYYENMANKQVHPYC